MIALIIFVHKVLTLYIYLIIIMAVMSWLVAFDVINVRNNFVRSTLTFLNAITAPILRPIRQIMPNLGGIDISPVILILIIMFIQQVILGNLAKSF